MIRNYLLDTNVLLESPESIFGFEENHVWICGTTLQELDRKKSECGEIGYSARRVCRLLDSLREQGSLIKGVKLPGQGKLYIEPDGVDLSLLPAGFSINVPDNRIISTCLTLNQGALKKSHVILVTNDISMRINASVCGLKVESYRNDHVQEEIEYTGQCDLDVVPEVINRLYADGETAVSGAEVLPKPGTSQKVQDGCAVFTEYQFVTLHAGKQSALSIFEHGKLRLVTDKPLFGGVHPLNAMQSYAIHALMAPVDEIPLVILVGPAGTAKTFLSLAAGLSQTYLGQGGYNGQEYRKVLISRPNVTTQEQGFGYLPGDLRDKTNYLLNNFYDNICSILSGEDGTKEDPSQVQMQINDMLDTGILEICPLNYIRGRSLTDSYIICDEAQNASRSLIRDVITRAGRNSKVVLAGDVNQVDATALDSHNNGLITALEMMKGHKCAIVRFSDKHCVRSELAEEAIKYMKW